jgi:hypothetical protein
MPTSHPRHTITETSDVASALDDAARHWPEQAARRGQLLLRLVQEGHRALEREDAQAEIHRREAVKRTAGALTDAYPPGYLERLRDDWPA